MHAFVFLPPGMYWKGRGPGGGSRGGWTGGWRRGWDPDGTPPPLKQKKNLPRLEEVAKAVGGGYCRLQMPLSLALAARGTVAGHRLGTLDRGGPPPLQCIPAPPPPPPRWGHATVCCLPLQVSEYPSAPSSGARDRALDRMPGTPSNTPFPSEGLR